MTELTLQLLPLSGVHIGSEWQPSSHVTDLFSDQALF